MRKPETLPQCNRALSDPEQFRREKWMGPFPCPNSALMEGKPTVQQHKKCMQLTLVGLGTTLYSHCSSPCDILPVVLPLAWSIYISYIYICMYILFYMRPGQLNTPSPLIAGVSLSGGAIPLAVIGLKTLKIY